MRPQFSALKEAGHEPTSGPALSWRPLRTFVVNSTFIYMLNTYAGAQTKPQTTPIGSHGTTKRAKIWSTCWTLHYFSASRPAYLTGWTTRKTTFTLAPVSSQISEPDFSRYIFISYHRDNYHLGPGGGGKAGNLSWQIGGEILFSFGWQLKGVNRVNFTYLPLHRLQIFPDPIC